jgi:ribokinase
MASSVVAVVGGINMDLVFETERSPDRGESLDASSILYLPGGKGANTAIALYRASHTKPAGDDKADIGQEEENTVVDGHSIRVFMNGAVGDDQFGTQLKMKLKMQNINISGIQTVRGNSGTCTVIVEILTRESRNLGYQAANLEWKARDPEAVESLAGGSKPDLVITHLGIP